MNQIKTNQLNTTLCVLGIIGMLFFSRPLQAQLVCGVENPAVELEWLSFYASNPIPPSSFIPIISAFELDGETYVSVNPQIPDGGTMIFNCAGDFLCYNGGLVYPQPICFSGGTSLGFFGIPGKTKDFPIKYSICAGEPINISMDEVGAPKPPLLIEGEMDSFDFSNVDYSITSIDINSTNSEMCNDCYSLQVSPQTTTNYRARWENTQQPLPLNEAFGVGYFLVEVDETCQYENPYSPIFSTYPWINAYVDPSNCNGTTTTAYENGAFDFIYVQTDTKGTLYLEDGTPYCNDDSSNPFCINAYSLNEIKDSYTCEDTTIMVEGCTDNSAINYNSTATIDDGSCQYENTNSTPFATYPWLSAYLNQNNCNGESIVVYDAGSYNFILIQNGNEGKLYFENGTYYCDEIPSYSCVTAYGLNNVSESWTCENNISISGCTDATAINYNSSATVADGSCQYETNCTKYTGTFFYQDCGGINYYFIRLEDGRIFDPYFADGIGFTPGEGQQILFDYIINTEISTPCTVSESPITITCYEEISGAVFEEYPWLNAVVNENRCSNESVTVYDAGAFNFIYIKSAAGNNLYYQDGTFYCKDTPGYSCLDAYNLTDVINSWNCRVAGIEADLFFSICAGDEILIPIGGKNCSCAPGVLTLDDGLSLDSYDIYVDDMLIESNLMLFGSYNTFPETSTTYTFKIIPKPTAAGCSCAYFDVVVYVKVVEDCGSNQTNKFEENMLLNNVQLKKEKSSFKLYPNPATDVIYVEPAFIQDEEVEVYLFDINGKLLNSIKQTTNIEAPIQININNLAKGIYVVELKSINGTLTKKLLIE